MEAGKRRDRATHITYKEFWVDIRTIQTTNGTKYTDESLKGLKIKKKKKKKKKK